MSALAGERHSLDRCGQQRTRPAHAGRNNSTTAGTWRYDCYARSGVQLLSRSSPGVQTRKGLLFLARSAPSFGVTRTSERAYGARVAVASALKRSSRMSRWRPHLRAKATVALKDVFWLAFEGKEFPELKHAVVVYLEPWLRSSNARRDPARAT